LNGTRQTSVPKAFFGVSRKFAVIKEIHFVGGQVSDAQQAIRYGMFLMPIHNPAKPRAQCYDEDLELVVRCEELGFSEFWCGEHHSSTYENIVMPEIFLAKALGMTKEIRLGPAPVCLQYHHPMDVANRLAFLDHLSHGRLNVCLVWVLCRQIWRCTVSIPS